MNYGELKQQIRDLGFEEDLAITEYNTIVINACNRAIGLINKTVVARAEQYFVNDWRLKHENDEGYTPWTLPELEPITKDTPEDFEIDLPDKVIDLVSLLASYYVWLDDDIIKASFYWNQYDDMKNQILDDCLRARTCTIGSERKWRG